MTAKRPRTYPTKDCSSGPVLRLAHKEDRPRVKKSEHSKTATCCSCWAQDLHTHPGRSDYHLLHLSPLFLAARSATKRLHFLQISLPL